MRFGRVATLAREFGTSSVEGTNDGVSLQVCAPLQCHAARRTDDPLHVDASGFKWRGANGYVSRSDTVPVRVLISLLMRRQYSAPEAPALGTSV